MLLLTTIIISLLLLLLLVSLPFSKAAEEEHRGDGEGVGRDHPDAWNNKNSTILE